MSRFIVVLAALTAAGAMVASASADERRDQQLEVATQAIGMIDKKVDERRPIAQRRLRALYRVTRTSRGSLFRRFDTSDRRTAVELKRLVRRDLSELRALEDELAHVRRSATELRATTTATATTPPLLEPIAGARVVTRFGERKEGRLRLTSRGIDLAAQTGAAVLAPLAGNVVYRGSIGGLGRSIVIASGEHWVVLGPLAGKGPAVGARVTRGETLGTLPGERLHLELRIVDERGGVPVSPTLLTK